MEKEQVFLSYASDDLETVEKLYQGLQERGVNVWFDQLDVKAGRWKKQIEQAISKSRYFIMCLIVSRR